MKRTSLSVAGISTLLIAASLTAATAADMVTKAPPPTAVTAPAECTSLWDFLVTSCPLSWYGITIYGTVDAGVTWQSHAAHLITDHYPLGRNISSRRTATGRYGLRQTTR